MLKIHFTPGVEIIGKQNSGSGIASRDIKEWTLPVGNLPPFSRRTESVIVRASQSGYLSISTGIADTGAGREFTTPRITGLQIYPRPINATPRVPADIVSYLGDRATAHCQARYPCKTLDASGKCIQYPDSPESRKCLMEENQKLFSGCGEPPRTAATVDAWQACLIKKYGSSGQ